MRRWCSWQQKFLSGLLKRAFFFQLPPCAQVDEVFEFPGLRFCFLAELIEHGLNAARRREGPAVENLCAAGGRG